MSTDKPSGSTPESEQLRLGCPGPAGGGPDAVVPENAERVIRAALGEDNLIKDMDGRPRGAAQTFMLLALAHENDILRSLRSRTW